MAALRLPSTSMPRAASNLLNGWDDISLTLKEQRRYPARSGEALRSTAVARIALRDCPTTGSETA